MSSKKYTPDRKFLHRHRLWCLWEMWGMGEGVSSEDTKPKFEFVWFFHWSCRIMLEPLKHVLHLIWSAFVISTANTTALNIYSTNFCMLNHLSFLFGLGKHSASSVAANETLYMHIFTFLSYGNLHNVTLWVEPTKKWFRPTVEKFVRLQDSGFDEIFSTTITILRLQDFSPVWVNMWLTWEVCFGNIFSQNSQFSL